MGQKVKPIGLRVGINRTWDSRWYAGRNYGQLLHQDIKLREYLMGRLNRLLLAVSSSNAQQAAHVLQFMLAVLG